MRNATNKLPAAVEMGRMGGKARAKKMTPSERSEASRKAVMKRWKGHKKKS